MSNTEQSKLIHVGFTDENSIERSTKSSGRFYSDSGGGQNIPLYMLEDHSSRRGHEYFCYVHNLETEIVALRDEVKHYKNQLDLACDEGFTPADVKKIKEANAQLANENFALQNEVARLRIENSSLRETIKENIKNNKIIQSKVDLMLNKLDK